MGATQMRFATATLLAAGLAVLPLGAAKAQCSSLLALPFCIAGSAVNTATSIATGGGPYYRHTYRYHRASYRHVTHYDHRHPDHKATAASATPTPVAAKPVLPPVAPSTPADNTTIEPPPQSLYGPPSLQPEQHGAPGAARGGNG
jgi:hypothetical protein